MEDSEGALEAQLLRRIAVGDRGAFERFYELYERRLYGYLRRQVGADADDALLDVMLEVWRSAPRFAFRGRVSTWILAIAHKKSVDVLRRRSRTPQTVPLLQAVPDPEPGPETLALEAEQQRLFDAALQKLAPLHREVLELTFTFGREAKQKSLRFSHALWAL